MAIVPEGEDRVAAVILMAFMIGVIQMTITLLRLGDLTRISHSVIVGFTLGSNSAGDGSVEHLPRLAARAL